MASTTQVTHPWRATARTIFAALVGFVFVFPVVLSDFHFPIQGAVGTAIAATAVVTRFLALPSVNAALETYVPWLGASKAVKQAEDVAAEITPAATPVVDSAPAEADPVAPAATPAATAPAPTEQ